jgi:hypothetical protein
MKPSTSFILAFILLIFSSLKVFSQVNTSPNNYTFVSGHLRFMDSNLDLGTIKDSEIKTDTLKIFNAWKNTMTISFDELPPFLECKAEPSSLKSQMEGFIIVKYNANLRHYWGNLFNVYKFHTNDSLEPDKNFSITTMIVQDFSKLTNTERTNPAKIKFDSLTHDFGNIKVGDIKEFDFVFKNIGGSDLKILQASSTCGCTASTPDQYLTKPGERSFIHVAFDSKGRSGKQQKKITVITNDPENQTIMLTISCFIE